jgi:hypothetical protein
MKAATPGFAGATQNDEVDEDNENEDENENETLDYKYNIVAL